MMLENIEKNLYFTRGRAKSNYYDTPKNSKISCQIPLGKSFVKICWQMPFKSSKDSYVVITF